MTAVMEKTPRVSRMKVAEVKILSRRVESVHTCDSFHISLSVPFEKYHIVVDFFIFLFYLSFWWWWSVLRNIIHYFTQILTS